MTTNTIQVSTARAKQDFSQLVNQVFYGGQRVVVTSRGKPKVAIVGLKQSEAGITVPSETEMLKQKRLQAFAELKRNRAQLIQETKGELPDPVEELRKMRHDRDQHLLAGLR